MTKGAKIIFLGDSQIEYGNWNQLLNRVNILNKGIAGDTTAGIINRMDEVYIHNPSKVFLEIGTNDLGMGISISKIMENFKVIISNLKMETNSEIFINSIFPVQDLPFEGFQNVEINNLNRNLKSFCELENIHFINLTDNFSNDFGNLKEELTNDGLHLNSEGYSIWVQQLKVFL